MSIRALAIAVLIVAQLGLTACTQFGARAIQGSRTDYNIALQRTDDEQLLLNLVRLRYRDRPLFLEISSLTSQFNFSGSLAASYGYDNDAAEESFVRGTVAVEERPTVTYVPLQGKDAVERVMTRLTMETIVLLSGSGWSADRVYRVCVEALNGVSNAALADGPTPETAPRFETFKRIAELLRQLQEDNMFAGARQRGEDTSLIRFRPEARERADFRELTEILRLDPNQLVYSIEPTIDRMDGRTFNIRTRSFQGIMYFLSQSVEAPQSDLAAGRVTRTIDASGEAFDWQRVTDGLMRIRSSVDRPDNAAVAVFYRDHWFFVDDSDLDSKSTFSMLSQIYSLQAGNISNAAPLLTIPVGGD
jgi:hypothetical protein